MVHRLQDSFRVIQRDTAFLRVRAVVAVFADNIQRLPQVSGHNLVFLKVGNLGVQISILGGSLFDGGRLNGATRHYHRRLRQTVIVTEQRFPVIYPHIFGDAFIRRVRPCGRKNHHAAPQD